MSRQGKAYAAQLADRVMAHRGIVKSAAARAELAKALAIHGEFLAGVAAEERRIIKANERLLERYEQAGGFLEQVIRRAEAIDAANLARIEAQAQPRLEAFVPEQWAQIGRRMNGMNGNRGSHG